ncbi:hypothetical protein AgCh_025011 [Apium graveolens]
MKDIVELIRGFLAAAQDRQRKYADLARKDIEYEVGDQVHSVFHVPMLRKYNADTKNIVKHEDKSVKLFRVLLRHPKVEESTWESESHLRERYPHLLVS